MQSSRIEALDRTYKVAIIVVSIITLGYLVAVAIRVEVRAEWRSYRVQYAKILDEKAADDDGVQIADNFDLQVVQNVLTELGKVDRCLTCHSGLDDPRMSGQSQPFTVHPGSYLDSHPPERFGCTICHEGQGRALETDAAHGNVAHWEYPMLENDYLFSACAQCHGKVLYETDNLFVAAADMSDESSLPHGAALLMTGKELAETNGCQGCHALGGVGGTLGLDISAVGSKTIHGFDFTHVDPSEPREVTSWLVKHFLSPVAVSPDTLMPDLAFSREESIALTAYMLSLKSRQIPKAYIPKRDLELSEPEPRTGEELYAKLCSACHGKNGERSGLPGVPAPVLNGDDTLAVAGNDYYRSIITKGRSETAMQAWGPHSGNLTNQEIDRIVEYIRSWQDQGPSISSVRAASGSPQMGRAFYQGLCSNCHGRQGEGGIGPSLNAQTFLAVASDEFLANSIIHGRPGTAMASWSHLSAAAVSDLISYIRTWHGAPPSFKKIERSLSRTSQAALRQVGKAIYDGNCAACHLRDGHGDTGPSLNSPEFLGGVDDRYIYRAVVEGRPNTAMPAWRHLSADDVAAVTSYIRSWQKQPAPELYKPRSAGDYEVGEVHYKTSCLQCHGTEGQGGVGPQLVNKSFLDAVSDATLFHWIGNGRTGSAMKGFLNKEQGVTRLEAQQIIDVIAYLRHVGAREENPILRTAVGDPRLGQQLFKANCISCHGDNAEGRSGPQLNNPMLLQSASDGFYAATIMVGRSGTPMRSMIHGQEGLAQISRTQVQDIISYLRLWDNPGAKHQPRSIYEINERSIASGKEKFTQFCSGCHGVNGRGQKDGPDNFAPALNNPEFLESAHDGFLLATIARGRTGTPMRAFGKGASGIASLGPAEINDIVSYVRTWQEQF